MIDTIEALDILEMFDMFQGQRAGRELWSEKHKEIQDMDIEHFSKRVSILKEFIIKQQNEIDELRELVNSKQTTINELEKGTIEYEV